MVFLLILAAAQSCGKTPIRPNPLISTRIVGGTEARPNSYPWQVSSIMYKEEIIMALWLTLVHCYDRLEVPIAELAR